MDKVRLILIWILIGISKVTMAYSVAQKIESNLETSTTPPTSLNDPTMPKVTSNLDPLNEHRSNNVVTQGQSTNNPDKLNLSIIIIKPLDRTAVINDKILREKDQISGYEVIKIENNKVTLKNPKNKAINKKPKTTVTIPQNESNAISEIEQDSFTELKLPSTNIKSLTITDLVTLNQFNPSKADSSTETGNEHVYN